MMNPSPNKNHFTNLIRLIGFVFGVAILAFTIHQAGGLAVLTTYLLQLGYNSIWIIVNSFVWMLVFTEAWRILIFTTSHRLNFIHLLRVKVAGEAVNFMTPLGFVAGDSVRVMLLKKYVGPEARSGSVIVDRILHSLAAQYFCLIGVCLVFTQKVGFSLWVVISTVVIYAVSTFFLTYFLINLVRTGRIDFIENHKWIKRLIHRFPKIEDILEDIKNHLVFYKDKSPAFLIKVFLYHLLGRYLGVSEIMIALYFLTGHASFIFCYILASFTSFVSVVFGFIPGAIGVLESMYVGFFALYGYQPEIGLSLQIIRRLRVLFWVGVGILVVDYNEVSKMIKSKV